MLQLYKIIFEPMNDRPVLLLAPPIFLALPFLFYSRAKVDVGGCSCLPGLSFGREGKGDGGGRGGEKGAGAAKNAAR